MHGYEDEDTYAFKVLKDDVDLLKSQNFKNLPRKTIERIKGHIEHCDYIADTEVQRLLVVEAKWWLVIKSGETVMTPPSASQPRRMTRPLILGAFEELQSWRIYLHNEHGLRIPRETLRKIRNIIAYCLIFKNPDYDKKLLTTMILLWNQRATEWNEANPGVPPFFPVPQLDLPRLTTSIESAHQQEEIDPLTANDRRFLRNLRITPDFGVVREIRKHPHELTANDRRFLRSLRIAAEDNNTDSPNN